MKTYKLGNKIDCIIRSYCGGKIGSIDMKYGNQPYTVLKEVEASLRFSARDKDANSDFLNLTYNADNLDEITISDVELNDRILNLIFSKNEENLAHAMENCESGDDKIIYIKPEYSCQVFVYDIDGNLENAYGELKTNQIPVQRANEDYLVFYSYPEQVSYSLKRGENLYLTLDLILTGNRDDEFNKSYIHIEKCALQISKDMYFNERINSIDLTFKVLKDGNNYITLGS
ncbi:hypothetical protein J6Q66_01905 [bacterium]|nr:hypothetical protein [bacterium]